MTILGIETSCDETAAAVIEGSLRDNQVVVLSSVVASSEKIHIKTGGIVPEVAAREQVKSIVQIIDVCMQNAKCKVQNIDAIAATVGPGLIGSLLVGIESAKALALSWKKPLVPVNHLLAHLYANWIGDDQAVPEFPAVGMVVSGGHTDLVMMKSHKEVEWIGGTRDDAAGECFDKCARILGLPYPGGPAIEKAAKQFINRNSKSMKLPRPMSRINNLEMSFSGLKTALARKVNTIGKEKQVVEELAYEVQEAIVEVLVEKLMLAVKKYKPKSVLLAGGVAANSRLRELLKYQISNIKYQISLFIPPVELCTDNAVCVGVRAFYSYSPLSVEAIHVNPSLEIAEKL